MSLPPLDDLRCPECSSPLEAMREDGEESARCTACRKQYDVKNRVLDLTPVELQHLTRDTVQQFGDSWSSHEYLAPYQEKQFLDWIAPLTPEDFRDKVVLDAGCGKGRHSFSIAGYGIERLYAMDLSEAVFLAAEYTKAFRNVHCIRTNILKLPMADASVHHVNCLGVLHHLEDPEAGLGELWRVLKPGGTLCLWVYAREGNGWIVHFVDPIRKGITSRIPTKLLRFLLLPLTFFLYILLKIFYGPITGKGSKPVRWLPYSAYLGYISKFPSREIEHIVLDHLCPPIAHYLSRPTLESWFERLEPEEIHYRWHNRNSWNVVARKAARTEPR
jgi:SAM-dependent methyltransferase